MLPEDSLSYGPGEGSYKLPDAGISIETTLERDGIAYFVSGIRVNRKPDFATASPVHKSLETDKL